MPLLSEMLNFMSKENALHYKLDSHVDLWVRVNCNYHGGPDVNVEDMHGRVNYRNHHMSVAFSYFVI